MGFNPKIVSLRVRLYTMTPSHTFTWRGTSLLALSWYISFIQLHPLHTSYSYNILLGKSVQILFLSCDVMFSLHSIHTESRQCPKMSRSLIHFKVWTNYGTI